MSYIRHTQNETREREEEVVHEGVGEGNLGGEWVVEPLPGPNRRTNCRQNEHYSPSNRRRTETGYHFRQSSLKSLQICFVQNMKQSDCQYLYY
jgi:hypothetical protein